MENIANRANESEIESITDRSGWANPLRTKMALFRESKTPINPRHIGSTSRDQAGGIPPIYRSPRNGKSNLDISIQAKRVGQLATCVSIS